MYGGVKTGDFAVEMQAKVSRVVSYPYYQTNIGSDTIWARGRSEGRKTRFAVMELDTTLLNINI